MEKSDGKVKFELKFLMIIELIKLLHVGSISRRFDKRSKSNISDIDPLPPSPKVSRKKQCTIQLQRNRAFSQKKMLETVKFHVMLLHLNIRRLNLVCPRQPYQPFEHWIFISYIERRAFVIKILFKINSSCHLPRIH